MTRKFLAIIGIFILILCLFCGCSHKSEVENNVTFNSESLYIPEDFEKEENNSYYNKNTGETIVLVKVDREYDSIEEEISSIYGKNSDTKYIKIDGYSATKTKWNGYNAAGWMTYHVSYDIVKDDEIYDITFASPLNSFSDDTIIPTIKFD